MQVVVIVAVGMPELMVMVKVMMVAEVMVVELVFMVVAVLAGDDITCPVNAMSIHPFIHQLLG